MKNINKLLLHAAMSVGCCGNNVIIPMQPTTDRSVNVIQFVVVL